MREWKMGHGGALIGALYNLFLAFSLSCQLSVVFYAYTWSRQFLSSHANHVAFVAPELNNIFKSYRFLIKIAQQFPFKLNQKFGKSSSTVSQICKGVLWGAWYSEFGYIMRQEVEMGCGQKHWEGSPLYVLFPKRASRR